MPEAFPLIDVEGPARERGRQYGRQAAERIARGVSFYRGALESGGFAWPAVREAAADFAPKVAAYDPALLEELEGIAEGAGLELAEVVVINARSELLLRRDSLGSGLAEDGCTAAVALAEATRDGRLIHAQNWDWYDPCVETAVVLRVRPETGPAMLSFVEAGGLARCGFNAAGIAVTGNNLHAAGDRGREGVPLSLVRRRILQQERFDLALKAVFDATRAVSNNMIISCALAEGEAFDLEATPEEVFWLAPEQGLLVHANHFVSPAARAKRLDLGLAEGPDSLYRDRRLARLLERRRGALTPEDFMAALRDRWGAPKAVNRSPDPTRERPVATVAAVVMEPASGRLWVCPAPYRNERFDLYRLEQ